MAEVSPKLAPAREPTSSAEVASYPPARRRGVYGEGDAASGGGRRVRGFRARAPLGTTRLGGRGYFLPFRLLCCGAAVWRVCRRRCNCAPSPLLVPPLLFLVLQRRRVERVGRGYRGQAGGGARGDRSLPGGHAALWRHGRGRVRGAPCACWHQQRALMRAFSRHLFLCCCGGGGFVAPLRAYPPLSPTPPAAGDDWWPTPWSGKVFPRARRWSRKAPRAKPCVPERPARRRRRRHAPQRAATRRHAPPRAATRLPCFAARRRSANTTTAWPAARAL